MVKKQSSCEGQEEGGKEKAGGLSWGHHAGLKFHDKDFGSCRSWEPLKGCNLQLRTHLLNGSSGQENGVVWGHIS